MILTNYYFLYYLARNPNFVIRPIKFLFKEDVIDSIGENRRFCIAFTHYCYFVQTSALSCISQPLCCWFNRNFYRLVIKGYKYFKVKSLFFYHLFIRLIIIGGVTTLVFMIPHEINTNIDEKY